MAFGTIELSGGWRVRADPHERGRKDGWGAGGASAPADGWVAIRLPAPTQATFGPDAPPVCWYGRTLSAAECARTPDERVWLRFDAAATDTTVWVNGREAGRWIGDWVPFQFDVTDSLHTDGRDNEVIIRVDRVPPGKETWIDGAPVQGGHVTKGFHDVLSIHKAGLWQPVRLIVTGGLSFVPDGLGITADSRTGRVLIDAEFERNIGGGRLDVEILDQGGKRVVSARLEVKDGADSAHTLVDVPHPALWSPDSPSLYTVEARLVGPDGHVSQIESVRFGFRRAEVGGKDGRQIVLNDRPIFLSGILDWGHQPRHISPTATSDELRERFGTLKRMGFNLVCLCMWYPPRNFFDIADEMGMLLWQEHPVWKPPMDDGLIPEYQKQFTRFFRRDRNRASVVVVSGSCEHERFNPRLASWWWGRVRALMPDRIVQIQTAFFAWTDQTKTDAYDEHTYDSCGRWTHYLEDLQEDLDKLPPRPFVMGESILYTNWPDTAGLLEARTPNGDRPWWTPKGLDAAVRFESDVAERFGPAVLDRFKRQARRYHLQGRKFQFEAFRMYPNHAGLVMNHLNDVPSCRCGFQDEFDRWYFEPDELRPWLGPAPLLLKTEHHLRGLNGGGGNTALAIGISNVAGTPVDAALRVAADGAEFVPAAKGGSGPRLAAGPGEVAWTELNLRLPNVTAPARVNLRAAAEGLTPNHWTIWNLPAPAPIPNGVVRLSGPPFDATDREHEFEDKGYSSGWGSPVRSWSPLLPDPELIAPGARAWESANRLPSGARCILAHKLTPPVVDFLVSGGRVLLLFSRAKGGPPVKFVNMWGQLPLILERGPLGTGDADWVGDLLDHDLSRRSLRAIPSGELGLDRALEPIARLVYVHDIVDRPRLMDFVATARVGEGVLILSGADHTTPAGRYLLDRLLAFAVADAANSDGRLEESLVRSWAVPG